MKLRRIEVLRFRGLGYFVWDPSDGLNVLIGPGDSSKSTVLDAIDLVLGPRWNPGITDTDFTDGDVGAEIQITATIGELPRSILGDGRSQDHFRGWRVGVGIHDEPIGDGDGEDEPVLSARVEVNSSLEPTWHVWTERQAEPGPIFTSRDREKLGVVRVGDYVDRHLGWGRGSALSKSMAETDDLAPVFSEIRRKSRDAFAEFDLPRLRTASEEVGERAGEIGVRVAKGFGPGLDLAAIRDGSASVCLHDGEVPARQMGLGSKRLLAVAMQTDRVAGGQLLLVDEVETALEPYRIRTLIRRLSGTKAQVIVTTHSPVVLQESASDSIFQLTRDEHRVHARPADTKLKNLMKSHPAALLSRRVVASRPRRRGRVIERPIGGTLRERGLGLSIGLS